MGDMRLSTPTWIRAPREGRCYELFDSGVLVLVLSVFGYLLTEPPPATQATFAPIQLFGDFVFGGVLAAVSIFAIWQSYTEKHIRKAYRYMLILTFVVSVQFFIGAIANQELRPVVSGFIYGWIWSRLFRYNRMHR